MRHQSRRLGQLVAASFTLVIALSACRDPTQPQSHPPASSIRVIGGRGFYGADTAARVERLAQWLGEGLGEEDARWALHRALRNSRLFEHKVVLHEFLRGDLGAIVVAAAAERAGRTRREINALLDSIPPMDIYVAYKQHRRTWRWQAPIAVMALLDAGSSLRAHLAGGRVLEPDRTALVPTSATPFLVLGPREAIVERPDAGLPRIPSETIEDEHGPTTGNLTCYEDCSGGGAEEVAAAVAVAGILPTTPG